MIVFPDPATHPRAADAPASTHAVAAHLMMSVVAAERLLESIRAGVVDYVLTSADGRLSVRVALSLDSPSSIAQRFERREVVIDWSSATISNGDNRISLSRTELRLLGALLESGGTPVPRTTLIARASLRDNVLSGDGTGGETALRMYVSMLRRRLAAVGLGSAVETIRGVGYRIDL